MEQYFRYLESLRDSGVVNMFGAVPYLQREFSELGFDDAKAKAVLCAWMEKAKGSNATQRPANDSVDQTILTSDQTFIVTELCPHCESEIQMRWNTDEWGFQAFCPVCGKRLMLCDECRHTSDEKCPDGGSCDYNSQVDSCRHNPVEGAFKPCGAECPELNLYGSDHVQTALWDEEDDPCPDEMGMFCVVFDVGAERYYCNVEAPDLLTALRRFFRAHPNITYEMVVDHMEV